MKIFENSKFKAGIVQFDVRLGDISENVRHVLRSLELLADQGVRLAVLPEMWTCGFDNQHLIGHARKTPEVLDFLSQTADKFDMVIAGSMPEADGGNIYNTLYVVDADGTIAGAYRKVHLFRLNEEDKYFAGGKRSMVCRTSVGLIGAMICYDLRFPELCRAMALKGAMAVLVCAQWPHVRIPHWDILVQARAIENQMVIIAANRCGTTLNLEYGGHSRIVSPSGETLVCAGNEPSLPDADIDPDEISRCRKLIPCLSDRIPEAYEC